MHINPQNFINDYAVNPHSVRNFSDYTLFNYAGILKCVADHATDFLRELIIDNGSFVITDPIVVTDSGIILDGNLRYKLITQLINLYPDVIVQDIPVTVKKCSEPELYLSQVKTKGQKLTLRERIKAIDQCIEKHGEKSVLEFDEGNLTRYVRVLGQYKALPDWLKDQGDLYDVSISTLLHFQRLQGTETDWKKVKKYATRDTVSVFRITQTHVNMIRENGKSSAFDVLNDENDQPDINQNENLDEFTVLVLQKLQAAMNGLDVEKFYREYAKICQDKKKFLLMVDKLLHILETIS
jgi:hypothetical protein